MSQRDTTHLTEHLNYGKKAQLVKIAKSDAKKKLFANYFRKKYNSEIALADIADVLNYRYVVAYNRTHKKQIDVDPEYDPLGITPIPLSLDNEERREQLQALSDDDVLDEEAIADYIVSRCGLFKPQTLIDHMLDSNAFVHEIADISGDPIEDDDQTSSGGRTRPLQQPDPTPAPKNRGASLLNRIPHPQISIPKKPSQALSGQQQITPYKEEEKEANTDPLPEGIVIEQKPTQEDKQAGPGVIDLRRPVKKEEEKKEDPFFRVTIPKIHLDFSSKKLTSTETSQPQVDTRGKVKYVTDDEDIEVGLGRVAIALLCFLALCIMDWLHFGALGFHITKIIASNAMPWNDRFSVVFGPILGYLIFGFGVTFAFVASGAHDTEESVEAVGHNFLLFVFGTYGTLAVANFLSGWLFKIPWGIGSWIQNFHIDTLFSVLHYLPGNLTSPALFFAMIIGGKIFSGKAFKPRSPLCSNKRMGWMWAIISYFVLSSYIYMGAAVWQDILLCGLWEVAHAIGNAVGRFFCKRFFGGFPDLWEAKGSAPQKTTPTQTQEKKPTATATAAKKK